MRIDEYLRIYEAKHDDELLLLAESSAELTDEARAALGSELARRGLRPMLAASEVPVVVGGNAAQSKPFASQFAGVGEFLNAVMSTYRSNFWLFIWLIAPAILFAFFGRELGRMFGQHLLQQFLTHA